VKKGHKIGRKKYYYDLPIISDWHIAKEINLHCK
jgi:hypothetical protein